jgi:hypothetical protein
MERSSKRLHKLAAGQVSGLAALLYRIALILLPFSLNAAFVGDYALSNFTLTNTNLNPSDVIPANGFAEVTPAGELVLTGSNTGSGLMPGATTYLTTLSRGTGEVSFDWSFSSLDIPEWDIGGYIQGSVFNILADSTGQSGSVSFLVTAGETFGFGVQTIDNAGEPGILTISNFSAPGGAVIPEPGTSASLLLGAGGLALWRLHRRKFAEEKKQ